MILKASLRIFFRIYKSKYLKFELVGKLSLMAFVWTEPILPQGVGLEGQFLAIMKCAS